MNQPISWNVTGGFWTTPSEPKAFNTFDQDGSGTIDTQEPNAKNVAICLKKKDGTVRVDIRMKWLEMYL